MNLNENDQQTIEPIAYRPPVSAPKDDLRVYYQITVATIALLLLAVFWFLFSAKTVSLKFSSKPTQIALSGGINLKIGDSFLLLEGQYLVNASSKGYFDLSEEITVQDNDSQSFEFLFVPLDGFLRLITEPADASILIDETQYTQGKPIQLRAGLHEVNLSHPMYINESLNISINGKLEEQLLTVSLDPDWADTTVSSMPQGANIELDGTKLMAKTPTAIKVPSGEREILVRLAGYKDHRERFLSVAGQALTLEKIKLVKADVLLKVKSNPSDASVIVNGQYAGQTPINLELRSDKKQKLKILKTGYVQYQQSLTLKPNQTKSIYAKLIKNLGKVSIEVEPKAASTLVNGQTIGQGDHSITLPTEPQNISIKLEGYASFSKSITPKLGITQSIKVRLLTNQEARLAAMTPVTSTHLGQNLVLLQPFDFQMGASRREPGRRANETLRQINMDRLFYLGTKEVTNKEFRQFAEGHDSGKYEEQTLNEDDMPVARIGWQDAALFCNWLSEQSNLEPFYQIEFGQIIGYDKNATGYRLPTEAEWAWAARAQETQGLPLKKFPWGERLPPPDRTGNYADRSAAHLVGRIIFGYNDNYTVAAPVATYKADSRGLFDLGGNVAEWIHDYYEIPGKEETRDPIGPAQGDFHVIKGSSWMHGTVTDLRYSFRDYGVDGRHDVGFRIARYAE